MSGRCIFRLEEQQSKLTDALPRLQGISYRFSRSRRTAWRGLQEGLGQSEYVLPIWRSSSPLSALSSKCRLQPFLNRPRLTVIHQSPRDYNSNREIQAVCGCIFALGGFFNAVLYVFTRKIFRNNAGESVSGPCTSELSNNEPRLAVDQANLRLYRQLQPLVRSDPALRSCSRTVQTKPSLR